MSHVMMTAYDLRKLCLKVKRNIENTRNRAVENYITEKQNKKHWWNFGKKANYDEKYRTSLYKRYMDIGDWATTVAERLLTATEVSPMVYVDTDDIRILKDWGFSDYDALPSQEEQLSRF